MQKKYKNIYEYQTVFNSGAIIYMLIELIYRGHTHFTMILTGGICALAIHFENKMFHSSKFVFRCAVAALAVTLIELFVGITVNVILKWNVWDYSYMKFNILGQICPLFSLYWFFLSIPAIKLSDHIAIIFEQLKTIERNVK